MDFYSFWRPRGLIWEALGFILKIFWILMILDNFERLKGESLFEQFSYTNRQSVARGQFRCSKVRSGTLPDGCSNFSLFLGSPLGGPMCCKCSTVSKRHFAVFEKVGLHFGACGAPLTLMWRTLGAKSLKMSLKRAIKKKLRNML